MGRESTRFHPPALAPFFPSFPPLSLSVAQDWTACQWPELVPTHSHPGPTPLVLVSFSLGFIHPLVLSSLSKGTYHLFSLLGNLPVGVYLRSRVHLSLGAFLPVSPVFSFYYGNSTCLHLSLAGVSASVDVQYFRSYSFPFFSLHVARLAFLTNITERIATCLIHAQSSLLKNCLAI